MDRELFVQRMEESKNDEVVNYVNQCEELDGILSWSLENATNNYMKDDKQFDLAVVIEEMAELTQELTKSLRGKQNPVGLLEEMADVQIGIWLLMRMFNISAEELNRAIQVKVDRQKIKKEKGVE